MQVKTLEVIVKVLTSKKHLHKWTLFAYIIKEFSLKKNINILLEFLPEQINQDTV